MKSGNGHIKQLALESKVLVLGKSGVGKSYILLQYTAKETDMIFATKTTIEVDFKTAVEKVEDTEIRLRIWDTAGQEKYRPIITTYFKNSKAAVFVFDLTDPQSLNDVNYWLRMVKQQCGDKVIKILVGNKCDLIHEEPDQEQIKEYCDQYNMQYIRASALDKINIKEIFQILAKEIYQQTIVSQIHTNSSEINNNNRSNSSNQNSDSSVQSIKLNPNSTPLKNPNKYKKQKSCC